MVYLSFTICDMGIRALLQMLKCAVRAATLFSLRLWKAPLRNFGLPEHQSWEDHRHCLSQASAVEPTPRERWFAQGHRERQKQGLVGDQMVCRGQRPRMGSWGAGGKGTAFPPSSSEPAERKARTCSGACRRPPPPHSLRHTDTAELPSRLPASLHKRTVTAASTPAVLGPGPLSGVMAEPWNAAPASCC